MTDINHEELAAGAKETNREWRAFEHRLRTFVHTMKVEGDSLVLEVGRTGGLHDLPTMEFVMGDILMLAIAGDHLDERHGGRAALVTRAMMWLRNKCAIPHPHLLTHRASGPCAQWSGVLGLEWTKGAGPGYAHPADRDTLLDLVEQTIGAEMPVGRDEDDDFFVDHEGQRIWIRVLPNVPAIEITARAAHGTVSRRQAAVEVGILNRSNPWIWWQVIGRDVFQTAIIDTSPFAPEHLTTTLEIFLNALSATRDDLALRVGGEVA